MKIMLCSHSCDRGWGPCSWRCLLRITMTLCGSIHDQCIRALQASGKKLRRRPRHGNPGRRHRARRDKQVEVFYLKEAEPAGHGAAFADKRYSLIDPHHLFNRFLVLEFHHHLHLHALRCNLRFDKLPDTAGADVALPAARKDTERPSSSPKSIR